MEVVTRMAAQQQTDALASAAGGDQVAFRRIIDAHHEDMRRVCAFIAGDINHRGGGSRPLGSSRGSASAMSVNRATSVPG